jgi:NhaP-type Na+/H+ or K+/H+ antiporter
MAVATTVLAIILVWSAVSGPLDRRGVTSALFLTSAGFVVGTSVLGLLDVSVESVVAERVAEIALVLLLFSDATRIDVRSLRHQLAWPSRLLLIGLPLTMLAGTGVGALLFPGMALASVVLLATMLASTDAALGQRVVSDPAVPTRVRQALDVESGLNDGLAVPFFLVALDIANADLETGVTWAVVSNMAAQIGWGMVGGLGAGLLGGLLFGVADRRSWISQEWRQTLPLVVALASYSLAVMLGGSGFIAAFVGGIAFGSVAGAHSSTSTVFTEEAGDFLAAITWIGFGALALTLIVPHITWPIVLYALLSLTIVRMIPVAIAFAGQGVQRPTVAFVGWFGPRGLASIVFALVALERGIPDGDTVLAVVAVTVALSVVLHGLTSVPLVALYRRWYDAHTVEHASAKEATQSTVPRQRRRWPGTAPAIKSGS